MGIIVLDLFITLDGVYQAPGGPDEDLESGFAYGGWQAPISEEQSGADIMANINKIDALLLGRKTYDIFAAYWPTATSDTEIADLFNAIPKFVASRTLTEPKWAGTTAMTDAVAEVGALRDRFDETHIIGSGDLSRSLLPAGLIDRLNFWMYPIVIGTGKRLFSEGFVPASFRLVQPPRAYPNGAVLLVYEPTNTGVETGEMG